MSDVMLLPVPLSAGWHLHHLLGNIGWSEFLEIMMHTLQQNAEDPDSGQNSYQVRQWPGLFGGRWFGASEYFSGCLR